MQTIIIIVHTFAAIAIVGLVLIQHGKGADVGASFGGGASGSVFGSRGSASFLTKVTASLATVFFALSILLAYQTRVSQPTSTSIVPTNSIQAEDTQKPDTTNGVPIATDNK